MGLQFLVLSGPNAGRVITLQPGPNLMLGRSDKAFYQLTDPRVSRFHCQFVLDADQVDVIDHGGSGGTLVNGKPVGTQRLKLGDVVRVGDTELRLHMGDFSLDVALGGVTPGARISKPAPPDLTDLETLPDHTFSHFDVGHVIGRGRSGLVFFATDLDENRSVALKVLHAGFARDEEMKQRFIRGMKTAIPLRHPNLISVYTAGKTGRHCWVAMEYVAGESLTEVIARIGVAGMLDWKHAFRVALEIGRALEYAHGHGIVHRNVTPTNVMRQATDKACKLGDLVLAKALEGAEAITRPGELVGDVEYMSPERTRGQTELDARSDLYGLGATVYALLTGRPPFQGDTVIEVITKIRQHDPVRPTQYQMSIAPAFEGVVLKLLAKKPEDRFQTAGELVRELGRVAKFNGLTV